MTVLGAVLAAVAISAAGFWVGRRGVVRHLQRVEQDAETGRRELKRRMDEIFSLQELSYLLADTASVDRIADQVAQYVMRFIASDGVVVALFHAARHRLSVVGASGSLEPLRGVAADLAEASLITLAISNEHLETASGSPAHPITIIADHTATGTAASVPLQAHGEVLGAMALVRDGTTALDDTDFRLLSTAATHAALAIGNARFVELIRSGKDQWEATFDAIADGIAVIDDTGRIRRGNQALAELLATPVVDLIGLELAPQLVSQRAIIDDVVDASREADPVTHVTRSDTLNRVLRVTAASIGDDRAWTVVLIEDVTEQKALEASVIQNEKMAAVGQLVSGVAHELNNPLTSISGLTEFLLQQPYIEARGREHLKIVHEQADRAAAIVRNLLTFARQGSPGSEHVGINDVVERAAALMRYEMKLREITFSIDLDPKVSPVFGDRFQLQQVVLNLVTNAIHAVGGNPPGRDRVITVRTSQKDGNVVLDVADTGPGISEDARSRVFDPFFTTKEPGEGTGLGLSITYGIVKAHGGDINITASNGGGGHFVVSLPAAPTPESEDAPVSAPARPSIETESTGLVLVVDRDEAVRQMIHLIFSHVGHDVVIANADDSLEASLDDREFDIIIADPRTPVPGGESFADWLCRTRQTLLDRTIFLTADVREETTEWLQGIGCRFFHKPFNVQELKKATDEILRRRVDQSTRRDPQVS